MASIETTKNKGESIVLRRFVTLAVSSCLLLALGLTPVDLLFAQGDAKKEAQPPAKTEAATKETAKTDATKAGEPAKKQEPTKSDATKTEPAKTEPAKPAEPPLPPIPPEVQVKIDAARKAVAEAIVAAQDAGLIETTIDPPPILDLLINGRATDARILKGAKPYGVSPEVMGAWFTGYGKMDGINYVDDVRIMNPSAGLKPYYDLRARIMEQYIQEARKAKGPAPAAKKAETKPAEPAKAPEVKKAAEAPKGAGAAETKKP
jgi:hypothetical protein